MADWKLILNFSRGANIELSSVEFHTPSGETLLSVRGKTAGAYRGAGTFQWTAAVKALALLAVSTKIDSEAPLLKGVRGSLASSLDFAISKGTTWLCEMFGTTAAGESVAKRLFSRSNPNLKRPGPVTIAINPHFLEPSDISIFVENKNVCEQLAFLALLQELVTNAENGNVGEVQLIKVAA